MPFSPNPLHYVTSNTSMSTYEQVVIPVVNHHSLSCLGHGDSLRPVQHPRLIPALPHTWHHSPLSHHCKRSFNIRDYQFPWWTYSQACCTLYDIGLQLLDKGPLQGEEVDTSSIIRYDHLVTIHRDMEWFTIRSPSCCSFYAECSYYLTIIAYHLYAVSITITNIQLIVTVHSDTPWPPPGSYYITGIWPCRIVD